MMMNPRQSLCLRVQDHYKQVILPGKERGMEQKDAERKKEPIVRCGNVGISNIIQ